MTWLHWLAVHTGSQNFPGIPPNYDFFSGFGSLILPPLLTVAGVAALWCWHRKCEVHRCWRIGRHKTAAGHGVCRRHHPDGPLTAQAVADAHQSALRKAAR